MSSPVDEKDFSDDLFAHTRMSFWDHIEVLRTHLWKAIVGFIIAMIASLFVGDAALRFITAPVSRELRKFNMRKAQRVQDAANNGDMMFNQPTAFHTLTFDRRQLELMLKGRPTKEVNAVPRPVTEKDLAKEKISPDELPPDYRPIDDSDMVKLWTRIERPVGWNGDMASTIGEMIRPPELVTMNIMEGFMVWLKVSMYLGVVVGSPWIFYQLWSFVAAGLYPTEKAYVYKFLPLSVSLFLAGVCVCQFLVIPVAVEYLLSFNEWLHLEPDLRLNEWLSFAIFFPLIFGVCFQLPLLMLVVHKLGLMDVATFRNNRRIAWFGMAVASMLLAASPDPFSMMAMTVPMWILYELGIILCHFSPRAITQEDEPDSEALIGV